MIRSLIKGMSLKTRVALAVSALFVIFVTAAFYFTLSYFESQFKETIATQQFSLVSTLADNIDDKLRIAQNALIVVAPSVPRAAWTDADKAQQFLDARIGVKSIFDNVVFLMSKEGKLIAESPYKPNRRGRDLSFRDYYKIAFATGKPCISGPFISTHRPGNPSICMTVPIFDARGNLTGFLGGGIDMLGGNFLAELSKTSIGKGGYLYITDEKRTMIVHPDKGRIMKLARAPGGNKLHEQAVKGFEGSGETINTKGIPMISSFKHLHMTSWILAANYPESEAYAPLEKARSFIGNATMVATAMLLLITWLIMDRLMSAFETMTYHMRHLQKKTGKERLIQIDSSDEIGDMAMTFNTMLNILDSQQEELERDITERKHAEEMLHDQALQLENEMAERQLAQESLVVKQQQLEALNSLLEERILTAINDLRQKDRMLIQQSRQAAMGEMINNIAHQWRQPLNNLGLIVQNLQLVFEMGQLELEEMNAQSDMAMETILFMSRTIDDFRNFFQQDKEQVRFNVSQVVSRTISIVEGSLKNQQVIIEINATDEPVIYGYPNEYSQVLLNILINARDALAEQRISDPRVVLNICTENGKSVVTITDNAGGIPADLIDRIFDPYFTTKGPDKGTGVGLFMSKEIIEKNMNGRLTTRNIGNGAEFRIEV